MTKADQYLKQDIENILANGYKDVNPRPHYKDGITIRLRNLKKI